MGLASTVPTPMIQRSQYPFYPTGSLISAQFFTAKHERTQHTITNYWFRALDYSYTVGHTIRITAYPCRWKTWQDLARVYHREYSSDFLYKPSTFYPFTAGSHIEDQSKYKNCLATTALKGNYQRWTMIDLPRPNYDHFWLQACWDNHHCTRSLKLPDISITQ